MQTRPNVLVILTVSGVVFGLVSGALGASVPAKITQGTLRAIGPEDNPLGDCPLEHTDVQVSISGFVAYVQVTQKFANPFKDKIEAVYTFPLGAEAAVTDMTMKVGDRVIRGIIKPREEARQIYEQAKARGHVASLLDQERPNIFTQSVANIEPGKRIEITISYTELLKYGGGKYEFVFPMVVAPRFIPGGTPSLSPAPVPPVRPVPIRPLRRGAETPAGGEPSVADASKLVAPLAPKDQRAGHDISVRVYIQNGQTAIKEVESALHEIAVQWPNDRRTRAVVELAQKKEIPNKDFVLRYSTASEGIGDTVLTHVDAKKRGYFTLILEPPKKVKPSEIRARELIFVIDISGSQKGFPLDTSKAIMERVIKSLRPLDTFNVISFENTTAFCWDKPVANTTENREKALAFIGSLQSRGGTRIDKALEAALGGEHDGEKVRLVAMFTDGLIGNDMSVLEQVQKHAKTTRVFVYGTGRSANRYLLENMARYGRGEVDYAMSPSEAQKAVDSFYDRIDAPVLTDVSLDWGKLSSSVDGAETYPRVVPDLFSIRPLIVKGRYEPGDADVSGELTIRGYAGSGVFERKVPVTLSSSESANGVIASQWARAKVGELMSQHLGAAQRGQPDPAIKERIIGLGVTYRLLTQYTSFVAVEEKVVTIGGEARTVAVPVELPEGMDRDAVTGRQGQAPFGGGIGGGGALGARRALARGRMPARPAAAVPGTPLAKRAYDRAKLAPRNAAEPVRERREGEHAAKPEEQKELTEAEKKDIAVKQKLAKVLQHLAAKLDKDGNYAEGKVVVKGGKMEVAVYLYQLDDKALEALKKLGFVKLLEAEAVKMVVGTIEVAKLEELAWLDVVRRVDLPSFIQ